MTDNMERLFRRICAIADSHPRTSTDQVALRYTYKGDEVFAEEGFINLRHVQFCIDLLWRFAGVLPEMVEVYIYRK